MNAPPQIPSRALKTYAAIAKGALWLLGGVWLTLLLAWGALHGFIVPRIGELRPHVEKQASEVLGIPVRIGAIVARSEGLIPTFELQNVTLLDPLGRTALQLQRVLVALSPRSLLHRGFEQLHIEGPELDVRRSRDGKIHIAGLDFSRRHGDDAAAADWLFAQPEFAIRHGTIRWTDEVRGAPTLALTQVDLVVRNRSRRHLLRVDATPPTAWGGRFMLAGDFRQPLLTTHKGKWQVWKGQLHADFAHVDISQLRQYADVGVRIDRGRGALRAWADIDSARFTGGTADVRLEDVDATLGAMLQPLVLQTVSGRAGGRRLENGFEFETQGLQFVTAEGHRWPGGNVKLSWSDASGRQPASGTLRGDRLDIGTLREIAARLPLAPATHALLQSAEPDGLLDHLQARWQGPLAQLQSYELRGRASGVELPARPASGMAGQPTRAGLPGLRNAQVDFEIRQDGGRARIDMVAGQLHFPGVFADPVIPVDALGADFTWRRDGQRMEVQAANLEFANADAQGQARLTWRTSEPAASGASRFPGELELEGSLARGNGARVWRYLPEGVPKAARDYVKESVQQGAIAGAKFKVRGDLRHFPFADPRQGEFLIAGQVRDVTYAYVPPRSQGIQKPWPALTQLAGELVFQGRGMQVRGATGRIAGSPRTTFKADARIADFDAAEVAVQGQLAGPLADSLSIVNASPLSQMTQQALARATGTGSADVQLKLRLPLAKLENSQVQGAVNLPGNDVQITPGSPMLARARGAVHFSENGFQIMQVQARTLGGDVRLEGGTVAGSRDVVVRAQGTATIEALRQASELGYASRVARVATGAANYALTLTLRGSVPEVLVTSDLQGVALGLPAPLNKPAESVLPLRYESMLTREALAAPEGSPLRKQEQLRVELGRAAAFQFLLDHSSAQPRALRGGVALGLAAGESAPAPPQGVVANVNVPILDVDAWQDAVQTIAAGDVPSTVTAAVAPGAAASGPRSGADSFLPTNLAIRARELRVEGRSLHNVVIGGSRDGLTWRANVDADELGGYVEYRQPANTGSGRLYARLARLKLAASGGSDVEALLEEQVNSIPALDVVVDDFELKGRKLGRLEIDAVNRGAGTVVREGGIREWRLNRLALTTPEATFTASGNWAAIGARPVAPGGPRQEAVAGEKRRTAMKFQLEVRESGALLARFGMKDVVRGGKGALRGELAWTGSPLGFDYPTLSGRFHVDVQAGQFLKAEPGLAKLLGVLSLQSLPRRLALDFRDVFSEGFSFDFVRGDVSVDQGIASTNNLQMKGVNAAVLMDGKADIARETQDLKVVVVPEINAGTASLVATVINPAIGLGSFLAQVFLREPLMRAATQEFHVDGTWSEPRVTRVPRASAAGGSSGEADPRR